MHIIGIDPGLVHTGVVSLQFYPHNKTIVEKHTVVAGPDAKAAAYWCAAQGLQPRVFVEGYRQRMKLATDKRMIEAIAEFRRAMKDAEILDNMGVKKIVKPKLMELLEVWNFNTVTHHQDLRSAARIGLFGAIKDRELNAYLGKVVVDYLNGEPWEVSHA